MNKINAHVANVSRGYAIENQIRGWVGILTPTDLLQYNRRFVERMNLKTVKFKRCFE